ncbi:DUF4238 domain-containing protein [Modestobacter sp. SYSU DS0290]
MADASARRSASEPRKHHIIPAFYLAGFTRRGLKTDRLNVFDYATGKRYGSTPLKACRKTDYNRVDEPGFDPNETEQMLSRVEADLAPAVQRVSSGELADRADIAKTLEFAAVCAARNHRARDALAPVLAAGIAKRLRNGEVSRDQWEQLRASELRNGVKPADMPEYDDAVRLLNDTKWFPLAPRVLTVGLVFELAAGIYETLMRKQWETHVTDADPNGGFICSDNPLAWGDIDDARFRHNKLRISLPTSLADDDVEVTFPVSKRVALVGYPGAREARCQTTDDVVAHVNSRTLHLSGKLIFYGYDNFMTHQTGGVIRKGTEYFAYVAEARRRGIRNP